MMFTGKAPRVGPRSYSWFDKPEDSVVNFMSISDFEQFVSNELGARLVKRLPLSSRNGREVKFLPNVFADEAIFVIADRNDG